MYKLELITEINDTRYHSISKQYYEFDNGMNVPRQCVDMLREVADEWIEQYGDSLSDSVLSDFNWGDFLENVDNDFLEKYSIKRVDGASSDGSYIVDHDELLA